MKIFNIKMSKESLKILSFLIVYSIVLCWAINNIGYRHKEMNGKIYSAIHIYLPGYIEVGKPADTFQLKPFVGSELNGFSLTIDGYKGNDTLSMEANAFLALKMTFLDSTYTLTKIGKDLVAISPEKSWKEWSWIAPYRLESWKLKK